MSSTAIISLISFTLSPPLRRLSLFRARIPYEKKKLFIQHWKRWWLVLSSTSTHLMVLLSELWLGEVGVRENLPIQQKFVLCHHRWETCLAFPRWTISTHPTEIAKLKRTQDFQLWFNLNTRARTLEWIHGMSIWRMKTTQNTKRN